MKPPTDSTWIRAFPLAELEVGKSRVFKHDGKQIAVFRLDEATLHAVDNRCPHEGYPLVQGYVRDCLLTCAWHNFKFDLRDGKCVLGDEDVRVFGVRVEDGYVALDVSDPDPSAQIPKFRTSLREAMLAGRVGQVARDVVRLLECGVAPAEVAFEAARFDAERAEFGSTHALAVATDVIRYFDRYQGVDAALPIMQAMDMAIEAGRLRPERPMPEPEAPGQDVAAAGARLAELVENEDAAGAVGLLRGALDAGWGRAEIEPMLFRVAARHFLDFGHALIYQIKVFDLLDHVGWSRAGEVLPGHLHGIVLGTREDTLPTWSGFGARLAKVEPRFGELFALQREPGPDAWDREVLYAAIVDGSGREMFAAMLAALEQGVRLDDILSFLAVAAGQRLLRFDVALDGSDEVQDSWLSVTHTQTFVHAVRAAIARWHDPEVLRSVWFAARFVNRARVLDMPAERRLDVEQLAERERGLANVDGILDAIASKSGDAAVGRTMAYLEAGENVDPLRIALEDIGLADAVTRPIVVAHVIKNTFAAFDEMAAVSRACPGDRRRCWPVLGLVRLLASPLRERRVGRLTHEAIGFAAHGRTPKVLL